MARSRNASTLDRHRPHPSRDRVQIRYSSALLLLGLSACASFPFSTTQLDAPPTPEQVEQLQDVAGSDSGTVVLRAGDRLTARWTIRDSGLELRDGPQFVAFEDVASLAFPESRLRRVARGAVAGSLLAAAVTATAAVAGADYEGVAAIASPAGLSGGVIYGLLVPAQRTFYSGERSRVDVLVSDPNVPGLVIVRISP